MSSQGTLYAKSQVTDYLVCGNQLETYNVVSFFADTYEAKVQAVHYTNHSDDEEHYTSASWRGHPLNE